MGTRPRAPRRETSLAALRTTTQVVDIMRSGAILQEAARRVCPAAKTAKILIQRDEATAARAPRGDGPSAVSSRPAAVRPSRARPIAVDSV